MVVQSIFLAEKHFLSLPMSAVRFPALAAAQCGQ